MQSDNFNRLLLAVGLAAAVGAAFGDRFTANLLMWIATNALLAASLRFVMLVGEFLRKVATGHFGLDFIGDEAVDECLGSIPDLYVLGCQPVHRQRSPTSID